MQVGTYTDGRVVSYDAATGQFSIGEAATGVSDLLSWEDQGLLTWSSPEMRQWARAIPVPAAAPTDAGRPAVLVWFRVYAAVLCLLYVGVIVLGFVLLGASSPGGATTIERVVAGLPALAFVGVGFVFLAAFAASFVLPRRGWVWVYDLVLICVGFTSVLSLIPCVFMLIWWLKPETKHYFGRA